MSTRGFGIYVGFSVTGKISHAFGAGRPGDREKVNAASLIVFTAGCRTFLVYAFKCRARSSPDERAPWLTSRVAYWSIRLIRPLLCRNEFIANPKTASLGLNACQRILARFNK